MKPDVKITKYVIRFGIVNLALLVGLSILFALLKIESGASVTVAALMGAGASAVLKFIKDNKRVPSASEKTKLVWLSYLASWLVSLFLFGIFSTITSDTSQVIDFMKSNAGIFVGVLVLLSIFYLGALYMVYGYVARKQFEGLQKKGKI